MRALFLIGFFLLGNSLRASASDSCTGKFDKDNRKHGVWLCKDGKRVVKKERYKHGELLTYIIFDDKGKVLESRNRKGKVKKYTPCGC